MSRRGSEGPVALVLSRLEKVRPSGQGWVALCPAHPDRKPSLSIGTGRDGQVLLNCHAGCELDAILAAVGLETKELFEDPAHIRTARSEPEHRRGSGEPFTDDAARRVWELSRSRALDDERCYQDQDVYGFLRARGLAESWELRAFGVLLDEPGLPDAVEWWPRYGYRLVVPLYDHSGELTCIQSRAVVPRERKVLFPARSRAKGTVFASGSGLRTLHGDEGRNSILLGEGLTDFLALSIASPIPVLASPGTGMATASIGCWVKGKRLFIATDVDVPGQGVVDEVATVAYSQGAERVIRLVWPGGCVDACDVLARVGIDGLEDFLEAQVQRIHS